MGVLVKKYVENGLSELFNLWVQTINVSDQAIFTLNDLSFHDGEKEKTNIRDPITVGHRQSGRFFLSG